MISYHVILENGDVDVLCTCYTKVFQCSVVFKGFMSPIFCIALKSQKPVCVSVNPKIYGTILFKLALLVHRNYK